ncbi:MAG: zf-HC2 domain-containing protein [Bacteroidetes bacterium]|nr:zf-HC2 domain-containing protein [Bacteroidota bacterium]
MSKLICDICRGVLPDYVDGKLDETASHRLRQHLASSPSCAEEERRLRTLFAQLPARSTIPTPMPDPAGLRAAINERLDNRTGDTTGPRSVLLRPSVAIPVFATVLLFIVGISLIFFPHGNDESGNEYASLSEMDVYSPSENVLIVAEQFEDSFISSPSSTHLQPEVLNDIFRFGDTEALEAAIDRSLLEEIPYEAIIAVGFDYLPSDEMPGLISNVETDYLVQSLEQQSITLL